MGLSKSGKEKVKLGEMNFLMLSGLSDPGGQDDIGLTLLGWLYRVNHPTRNLFAVTSKRLSSFLTGGEMFYTD